MRYLIPLILLLASQALQAAWVLDNSRSSLNYVSTKKGHVMEAGNTFTKLKGRIDDSGGARLVIALNSVDSQVPIRNQRMRQFLFETAQFPTAIFTAQVDSGQLAGLRAGEERLLPISGELELHGKRGRIATQLRVTGLRGGALRADTSAPVILNALDYALGQGIDKLKELARLSAISTSVPVTFSLVFVPE